MQAVSDYELYILTLDVLFLTLSKRAHLAPLPYPIRYPVFGTLLLQSKLPDLF